MSVAVGTVVVMHRVSDPCLLEDTPRLPGLSCGYRDASDRLRRVVLPGIRPRTVLRSRIIQVKLDTMSLISAAIAVAIWVVVIWTAIAAIVAHI